MFASGSYEGKRHTAIQVGTIENEYRVFRMEVLAGPPCLDTEVSQHGARFRLDFGEVRRCKAQRGASACCAVWAYALWP